MSAVDSPRRKSPANFPASFTLVLDQSEICAGEYLKGKCLVTVHDKTGLQLPSLIISVRGSATTCWIDCDNDSTDTHVGQHQFGVLEQDLLVVNSFLPPGDSELPFSIKTPSKLPSSFCWHFGSVTYEIELRIPPLAFGDLPDNLLLASGFLSVKGPQVIQDASLENLKESAEIQERSLFRLVNKKLSLEVAPTQLIDLSEKKLWINAWFESESKLQLKAFVELKVNMEFQSSEGHCKTVAKTWKLEPAFIGQFQWDVLSQGKGQWQRIPFARPDDVVPSTTDLCGIISVNYHLRVGIEIPNHDDLAIEWPVSVGYAPPTGETFNHSATDSGIEAEVFAVDDYDQTDSLNRSLC